MGAIEYMDRIRAELAEQTGLTYPNGGINATNNDPTPGTNITADELRARDEMDRLAKLAGKLPVTELIMHSLSSMMEALSNLALVLLFAIYLLLGSSPKRPSTPHHGGPSSSSGGGVGGLSGPAAISAQADAQINLYIRGKVAMSLLVGVATAISLGALQVDLWLVFGLLAFWLNFIPNVGTVLAVALPMPLVILDEKFTGVGIALALLLPLSAHAFAGNVLEPMMFGHTLKLHPVVILLSLLLWGTVWNVTGMVLAVPITAVLRIRLSHIQHPLPQFLAAVLVGESPPEEHETSEILAAADESTEIELVPPVGRGRGNKRAAESSLGLLAQQQRAQVEPTQMELASVAVDGGSPKQKRPGEVLEHHHAL